MYSRKLLLAAQRLIEICPEFKSTADPIGIAARSIKIEMIRQLLCDNPLPPIRTDNVGAVLIAQLVAQEFREHIQAYRRQHFPAIFK